MDKRNFLFRFVPLGIREQLRFDEEAFFSTTDQLTADRISKDLLTIVPRMSTITDATACVGGNTYSFAQVFAHVRAYEIDPSRCTMLRHNLKLLGVAANSSVKCGDASTLCKEDGPTDIVFIDPPWGGPEYKTRLRVQLFLNSNIPLSDMCANIAGYTKFIAIKVPHNFDFEHFVEKTSHFMRLVHKNTDLRKMHLIVFEVVSQQ